MNTFEAETVKFDRSHTVLAFYFQHRRQNLLTGFIHDVEDESKIVVVEPFVGAFYSLEDELIVSEVFEFVVREQYESRDAFD